MCIYKYSSNLKDKESKQYLLQLTYNAQGSCKSFHTSKFVWPSIIHWICSYQVGQQPEMTSLHLAKWCFVQLCPRAVNHRNSILGYNLPENTPAILIGDISVLMPCQEIRSILQAARRKRLEKLPSYHESNITKTQMF